MSIHLLPPELLRLTIESTIPHTYHSATYRNRQNTLRSLSLVSKLFRSLAQPLLLEVVHFDLDCEPRRVINSSSRCKIRDVFWLSMFRGKAADEAVIRKLTGLRSLEMCRHHGRLDIGIFSQCPELVKLHIIGNTFTATPLSPPLASLRTLIVFHGLIPRTPELMNPELLPSLEALEAYGIIQRRNWDDLMKTRFPQRLPQLNALYVRSDLYEFLSTSSLAEFSSRVLVGMEIESSRRPPIFSTIRHLRLVARGARRGDYNLFDRILTLITPASSNCLQSIYLDRDYVSCWRHIPETSASQLELSDECGRQGIDLVYDGNDIDSLFYSEVFLSRQRAVRRREDSEDPGQAQ